MTRLAALADKALRALAVVLLLGLLASVVAGVVSRQLGAPLAWSDELAQYLLVWTGFCGWLIASRSRSHIRITALVEHLPAPLADALEIVTQVLIMAFGLGLAWYSRGLIERTWDVESISLPVSTAVLYFPLPVLGIILAVQGGMEIAAVVRGRRALSGGKIL
jgi:TRAP-type C4-dicarboxylate transport system permease small subunit